MNYRRLIYEYWGRARTEAQRKVWKANRRPHISTTKTRVRTTKVLNRGVTFSR